MATLRKKKPAAEPVDGSAAGAVFTPGAASRFTPGSASRIDIEAARSFAAAKLGGAEVAQKFGNASFSIGGKVFAFTRPNGLVLKLPAEVLRDVIGKREAAPLVMGKRVMREWVLLHLDGPEQYREELELLRIAMAFVSQGSAPR